MLIRSLIVLLVVLNLGVAAWWVLHDTPAQTPVLQPAGVPRLQLREEATPVRDVPTPAPRSQAPATVQRPAPTTACTGEEAGAAVGAFTCHRSPASKPPTTQPAASPRRLQRLPGAAVKAAKPTASRLVAMARARPRNVAWPRCRRRDSRPAALESRPSRRIDSRRHSSVGRATAL